MSDKIIIDDFKKKLHQDIDEIVCRNIDNFAVVIADNDILENATNEVIQKYRFQMRNKNPFTERFRFKVINDYT